MREEGGGMKKDRAFLHPSGELPDLERLVSGRLQAGSQSLHEEVMAVVERQLLTQVLRHTGGNQVQAARVLGITRNSLRFKLRALGITVERSVWSADDQAD